jgi:hypothetical protein
MSHSRRSFLKASTGVLFSNYFFQSATSYAQSSDWNTYEITTTSTIEATNQQVHTWLTFTSCKRYGLF